MAKMTGLSAARKTPFNMKRTTPPKQNDSTRGVRAENATTSSGFSPVPSPLMMADGGVATSFGVGTIKTPELPSPPKPRTPSSGPILSGGATMGARGVASDNDADDVLALRNGGMVRCLADGGFQEPTIGGFLKDRAAAVARAIAPRLVKTADAPAVNSNQVAQAAQQAPAATPAPAPAPTQQGAQPFHFKRGGKVSGPGTGTSDSIPARLSTGEYVLPADTVRRVGVKKLDGLRAATHTFVQGKK